MCHTARTLMLIAAPKTSCASSALGSLAHWPRPGCWCQIQTATLCVPHHVLEGLFSRALGASALSDALCFGTHRLTVDCLSRVETWLASTDQSIFDSCTPELLCVNASLGAGL